MYIADIIDPQILEIGTKAPWFLISIILFVVIWKVVKYIARRGNDIYELFFDPKSGKLVQLLETQTKFVESVNANNEIVRNDILTTIESIKNIEAKISHMCQVGFENMNSEYFDVLFQQCRLPIAFIDSNMAYMNANIKFLEMLGYTYDELCKLDIKTTTKSLDYNVDIQQATRMQSGQLDFYRLEKTFIRRNGEEVFCTVYMYRIPNEGVFNHFIKVAVPHTNDYMVD